MNGARTEDLNACLIFCVLYPAAFKRFVEPLAEVVRGVEDVREEEVQQRPEFVQVVLEQRKGG